MIKRDSILILLICICSLKITNSADLYVDSSLTTANGDTYPSLSSAITQLLSSLGSVNTITLLNSTVTVTQTLPSSAVIQGTGIETLIIQFLISQTVSQEQDCNLLPSLSISSNQVFQVSNLSNFSLIGLNIFYTGSTSLNSISSIDSVSFSNFCFNNSEPTLAPSYSSYPSTYQQAFVMNSLLNFSITDCVYFSDGYKSLTISNTSFVTVSTIAFVLLPFYHQSTPILEITNNNFYNTTVSISQVQISTEVVSLFTPLLFWITNVRSAVISSMTMSDARIIKHAYGYITNQNIIWVQGAEFLKINNLSLYNCTTSSPHLPAVIQITNVKLALCTNFLINGTFSLVETLVGWSDSITGNNYPMSIKLLNWTVQNNLIDSGPSLIDLSFNDRSSIESFEITNLSIIDCFFGYISGVVYITFNPLLDDSFTFSKFPSFNIRNMTMIGNNFDTGHPFTLAYDTETTVTSVEVINFNFTNFYFVNNTVSSGTNIILTGPWAITISESSILNNTWENGNFIYNVYYYSSLMISNTLIANNSFFEQSQLIDLSATSSGSLEIELSMNASRTTVYALTRPMIIYNCTFTNNSFEGGSGLILSTNPMNIIRNTTFSQLTINNSQLIELGGYNYFLTEFSLFYDPSTGKSYPTDTTPSVSYPIAEEVLFRNVSLFQQLFDDTRQSISEFDEQGAIYFINLQDNVFDSLQSYQNSQLVLLDTFNVFNCSVIILNNTFTSITTDTGTNLITGNYISRIIVVNNTVKNSGIGFGVFGHMMYMTSPELITSAFVMNMFFDVTGLGFYHAEVVQCDNLTMDQNYILNSRPNQNFISLSCTSYSSPIIIQNSVFRDITHSSIRNVFDQLNFISISVIKASQSGNGIIIFQNNYLENVTLLNKEGYIQGIFQISMLFVMAVDSTFLFQNNTLHTLTVTPQGNVLFTSIPNIQFVNSTFTNWSFWDPNGAINIICSSVSITNDLFQGNQGYLTYGVGLLKINNRLPSPSLLNVEINDSIFEGNIGPSGTVLYSESTPIQLSLNSVSLRNNYVTDTAGLIYLYDIYSATVTVVNCNFVSTSGNPTPLLELQIFTFESPGTNVSMTINDSSIALGGEETGVVISISNAEIVSLSASNLSFVPASPDSNTSNSLQFSVLRADSIDAYFQEIKIQNLNIQEVALFILNCNTKSQFAHLWNLTITNSTFENLILSQGLLVVKSDEYVSAALDNLTIFFLNSTFENISWVSPAGIVDSSTSLIGKSQGDNFAVNIINCSFQNLNGTQGLIYNGAESQYDYVLGIFQSSIQNLTASGSGGVINSPLSLIPSETGSNRIQGLTYTIIESNFQEIKAGSGAILYWESQSKGVSIFFQDNSFEDITSSGEGTIYLQRIGTVNTSALNQSFIDTNFVAFYSKNSSYTNITTQSGGIIYSYVTSEFLNITLEESTFKQITANQSGGVLLIASADNEANSSTSGRLLQSIPQFWGNITILGSRFSSVSATDGGLLYEATPNKTLSLDLSNSTFNSFSVTGRGGVLFIKEPSVLITDNAFTNCSAKMAGPVIYSIANLAFSGLDITNNITDSSSQLVSYGPTNLQIEFIYSSGGEVIQSDNNSTLYANPIFSNLTSYSLSVYNISVTLVSEDDQGSIIVPDESTNLVLTLVFIPLNGGQIQTHIETTNCINSNCSVQATEITLQGNAGDMILVNVIYNSPLYTQFQQFYIKLRGCLPGEVNDTSTKGCTYCKYGTYSVNPNDTKCSDCPEGAICEGGAILSIQPGYYRSTNTSGVYIMSCNDSANLRCQGGYNSSCVEKYTGPACLQCDSNNGYLQDSSGCSKCYSQSVLITYGVLLLAASIAYQVIMITVTFRENKMTHFKYVRVAIIPSNVLRPGAFMVLFSTFCQICYIISDYDVGTVLSLFGITENIGNPNAKAFFSLRCLYYVSSSDIFESLRFQISIYVLSPLIKIVIVALFEAVRCLIWKGKSIIMIRLGAVAASLILLEQPGIVGGLCDYLHCTQLDPYVEEYYISKYNTIQCYTPQYNLFRNVFVIPALIIWGFVIPLAVFLILLTKREKLFGSLSFRLVFGNFYNGYIPQAYYWGVTVMILKTLIFILNSILNSSHLANGLILMCFFHIYFQIFKNVQPYHHKYLNLAEGYCYRAYMAILTLVFFRNTVLNSKVQTLCDVLIMLIVILAGGYILTNIFWLHIIRLLGLFDRYQILKKRSENKHGILNFLKEYHEQNPDHLDEHHRRNGILIELPPKLRNTIEMETEFETLHSKRIEKIQGFMREAFNRIAELFAPKRSGKKDVAVDAVKFEGATGIELGTPVVPFAKEQNALHTEALETQEALLNGPSTRAFDKFKLLANNKKDESPQLFRPCYDDRQN